MGRVAAKVKDMFGLISDAIVAYRADILVYGVEQDSQFGEFGDGGVPQWAIFSDSHGADGTSGGEYTSPID